MMMEPWYAPPTRFGSTVPGTAWATWDYGARAVSIWWTMDEAVAVLWTRTPTGWPHLGESWPHLGEPARRNIDSPEQRNAVWRWLIGDTE